MCIAIAASRWRLAFLSVVFALGLSLVMPGLLKPAGADVARALSTTPAPLKLARSGFGAVTATNGHAFVYSGSGSGGPNPAGTLEEYDPVANTWTLRPSIPCGTMGGILDGTLAAAANGRLYVVGIPCGAGMGLNGPSRTLEYDPATQTWTQKADLSTGRVFLAAVGAANGKVYAIGGRLDGGTGEAIGTVNEYDPATNTWTTRSPMPTPRAGVTAVARSDGKISVMGGNGPGAQGSFTISLANDEYDPATDNWTARAPLPARNISSLSGPAAAFIDGKIYGVLDNSPPPAEGNGPSSPGNGLLRFDPATNTWDRLGNTGEPSTRLGLGVAVTPDGGLLVISGLNGSRPTPTVLAYDTHTGGWYPDEVSPTIQSLKIQDGAAATTSPDVFLSLQASDTGSGLSGMRFSNDGTTWSDWEPFATTKSWTLTGGDGPKTVFAEVRDAVDNVSTSKQAVIILDRTAPTLTGLTINGGALATTSTAVNLTLQASDNQGGSGLSQMAFSNDRGATWSEWQSFSTTASWTLTSGDGQKTVQARVRDVAGNSSTLKGDDITLDTKAGTSFGVSINEAAIWTNTEDVTLTIPAMSGTAQMMLSNDGGFANVSWEPYDTHKAWHLDRFEGSPVTMIVYVRFGDASGAELPNSRSFDNIILDIEPPTGSVTLPGTTSASTRGPDSPIRPVQLTATDNLSGADMHMRLSNRADFAGAVWQPYATSATWDFTGGGTLYVQFRDGAGNVSVVYTQSLPGAGPPGTSPSPSCSPRPQVRVDVQPSNGTLAVTVSATGSNNGLRAVRFDGFANAIVDAGDQRNQSSPFALSIPAGQEPQSVQFTVRRQTSGQATTVRLVVIDGCGEWSTFVGGGPSAF